MSENKTIRFEADIEAKPTARFNRVLKEAQKGIAGTFSEKNIKGFGTQLDKVLKSMEKFGLSMTKVSKIANQQLTKSIVDETKAFAALGREMEKSAYKLERIDKATETYRRGVERRLRHGSNGIRQGPLTPAQAVQLDQQAASFRDQYQRGYTSNIESGSNMLLAKRERDEEIRRDRLQNALSRGLAAVSVLQAGVSAATGVAQTYYGNEGAALANQNAALGVVGRLYNEGVAGDFRSFAALAGNGNLDKLRSLAANGENAQKWQSYGSIASGGLQVAAGAGKLAVGGMLGGGFGMAVSGGANDIGSGVQGAYRGYSEAFNQGAFGGAYSRAMNAGIDALQANDPIFMNTLGYAQSTARRNLQDFRLNGGAWAYKNAVHAGTPYGMGPDETNALRQQLIGMSGVTKGNRLINSAVGVEANYGIHRNIGAAGLASLDMASGGGGEQRLERIIRRAFAEGIKDSNIKEALVEVAARGYASAGGRADSPEVLGEIMARILGPNADKHAIGAYQSGSAAMDAFHKSKPGGLAAPAFNLAARALRRQGSRVGGGRFNPTDEYALATMGADELITGSERTKALGYSDKTRAAILTGNLDLFVNAINDPSLSAAWRRAGGDIRKMSPKDQNLLATRVAAVDGTPLTGKPTDQIIAGFTYNYVGAQFVEGKVPKAALDAVDPRKANEKYVGAAGALAFGQASNQQSQVDASLNAGFTVKATGAAMVSTGVVGNADALAEAARKDPTALLNNVAGALNSLATAAENFLRRTGGGTPATITTAH